MLSSKLFKPSLSLLARPQIVQQGKFKLLPSDQLIANVFKRFNNTNTNPSVEQQIAALQKRVEALERSHKSQSESFADFTDWMKNKCTFPFNFLFLHLKSRPKKGQ